MDIETCVNRIWEVVLDSYGLNVEFTNDEVVVYQSAWEKEMKVRIKAILEEGCGTNSPPNQLLYEDFMETAIGEDWEGLVMGERGQ